MWGDGKILSRSKGSARRVRSLGAFRRGVKLGSESLSGSTVCVGNMIYHFVGRMSFERARVMLKKSSFAECQTMYRRRRVKVPYCPTKG